MAVHNAVTCYFQHVPTPLLTRPKCRLITRLIISNLTLTKLRRCSPACGVTGVAFPPLPYFHTFIGLLSAHTCCCGRPRGHGRKDFNQNGSGMSAVTVSEINSRNALLKNVTVGTAASFCTCLLYVDDSPAQR